MDDVAHEAKHDRRGREARRAARAQRSGVSIPYITRNSPLVMPKSCSKRSVSSSAITPAR